MLIEPDYRRHRIEVNAVAEGDRWNADVMIRRTLSPDKPHVEVVTCYKLRADQPITRAPACCGRSVGLT